MPSDAPLSVAAFSAAAGAAAADTALSAVPAEPHWEIDPYMYHVNSFDLLDYRQMQ